MAECTVEANSGSKSYKETKKTQLPFLGAWSKNRMPGAKAGYCTCPLHTLPPKGWAKPLSHTSSLTPEHTSTLAPYKVQAPRSL